MGAKMSVATRRELLKHIQQRYKEASYRQQISVSAVGLDINGS